MDITFVIPVLNRGGGTRIMYQRANGLSARGHDVKIVYSKVPSYLLDIIHNKSIRELVKKGFQTFTASGDVERSVDADFESVFSLTPRLVRYMSDRFPESDVIVAGNWRAVHAITELPESKGVPTFFVLDYDVWDLWNSDECWDMAAKRADSPADIPVKMGAVSPNGRHLRRQKRLVDTALQSDCRNLVLSPWIAELVETQLGADADVVPPGIETDTFYPDNNEPESISADNSFTVLVPSRAPKYKGTKDALEALDRVRSKMSNARFVLFGWEHVDVPDWAESVGWIDDDAELRRLYTHADVFISPSYLEGWGLPATEAAACGTAVVGTNTGWIRDYSDHTTVRTVQPRDVEDLAEGILDVYEDEEYRKSLAENSLELVTESFTIPKTIDILERNLKEILP